MNINANTLLHFTNSIDTLESIIINGFYPRMALDNYDEILRNNQLGQIALPIICFCDIPLHLIPDHMNDYGFYGIGMHKEWGLLKKINPVQYLQNTAYLGDIIDKIDKCFTNIEKNTGSCYEMNLICNLLAFINPFQGINYKNGKNKIFYDEREWRYFPNFFEQNDIDANIPLLFEKDFNTVKKEHLNNYLKRFSLSFNPSDIKYIFIKDETEISELSRRLDNCIGIKYTKEQIEVMKTKIISSKNIIEDF